MGMGDTNLEMDFTLESERSGIVNEPIFQMLMLGDWTGDADKKPLAERKSIEIDRDNFDDVMRGLGVRLDLETAGRVVRLQFNSLDDFHPDELYKSVPLFAELRDLRKRLRNADTFNSAARELRESSPMPAAVPTEPVTETPPVSENLLDAILSKPEGGASVPKPAVSSDISNLVNELVRPHLVNVDEGEQSAMVAAVDESISGLMRSILHNRRFQLLEAAWRGLFFVVRRTETASDLRIYILDVSKEDLTADIRAAEEPARSAVYKTVAAGRNEDPFAAAFGNYAFLPNVDDIASIIRLGKAAAATRTPFVSHIRPEVIGVESLAEHPDPVNWDMSGTTDAGRLWNAVRELPESHFLGLTMPRFLARLPYGSLTEPAETFSFEEFSENGGARHDDYLWANGCFAVAQLMAASYTEFGWQFGQQFIQDIEGLPLHMHKKDGETVYQSCAEVQLSHNAAEKLMEFGIMPLVSFKNTDRVRLLRFQAISDPVGMLKGRWTG